MISYRSVAKLLVLILTGGFAFTPLESLGEYAVLMDIAKGRFLEAEKAGEKSISSDAGRTSRNIAPLCYIYYKLRRYNKIFACIDQLESRIRAGDTTQRDTLVPASDITPLPYLLRSAIYLDLGNPQRALAEGEIGLPKVVDGDPAGTFSGADYKVEWLPVLGIASVLVGRPDDARRFLKMLEDTDIPYIQGVARKNLKRIGLARINVALGQYKAAFELLSEETGSFVISFGDLLLGNTGDDSLANQYQQIRLLMMAKVHLELGRVQEAKDLLDRLIKNKRTAEQGDIFWIALFERGRIAERESNLPEALDYFRRAIEIIEIQRSSLATEANKIGFVGDKQAVYGRLVAGLIELGRIDEAFDYVERSKSRALVDMLASKKDFAVPAADLEKARLALAQLDTADLASSAQGAAATPGEGAELRGLQVLRQEIRSAAPDLATLVTVTSVPAEEIKRLTENDETLVEYYYQGNDLYAFVFNRERLTTVKLDATGLVQQVQRFRRAIESPESTIWQESARVLYDRLWKPLEGIVTSRNVVLVGHGALHYLPFAALQKLDGSFLNDQYGLRFLPSASVLKFIRPASQNKQPQLLVLGNPDLGDPKLDLRFAEEEATAVSGIFRNSRILVRNDASETTFKKVSNAFSHLHFATHGKFQADEPLASGLYLAKDADNDGVLTVGELYSMNLDADLVTLSACETGLGKIANGDDVVGLTRGFLYAGSRSIVASLWSVDDRVTAELMKAFYENLRSMNKREALRQAQITSRQRFPHPFFWAAFQLTGRAE